MKVHNALPLEAELADDPLPEEALEPEAELVDVEPLELADVELELELAELDELLEEEDDELCEQGAALFVPSSATITLQRSVGGEPESKSAQTRTAVCWRTLWVLSLFSKRLVAVTMRRRGSPEG